MVEPTGVEKAIDNIIPDKAANTDIILDNITTILKLFTNLIVESAGNITKADINKEPTKFIPKTIIIAIIIAISKL